MKDFIISLWPNAKAVKSTLRKDIEITSFKELADLFRKVEPIAYKVDQPLMTRKWQESRARTNQNSGDISIITLDYDSTNETPLEIHEKLKAEKISHFIFTTWTHKTIETPQKKNNGKNCFKVIINTTASNPDELLKLTRSLAAKVGKHAVKKVDDISTNIFLGGAHPDFINEFEFLEYYDGQSSDDLNFYLKDTAPPEEETIHDPMDDFEKWDKTAGQKFAPDRIKRALSIIKYEPIEGFSRMAVWYSVGYALHSAKDSTNAEDADLFEVWDEWSLDNCSEYGVYNREENENFWAKQTAPERYKELCTLSTLWHLEKLFKAKESASKIRQSSWTFFDVLAEEEPEEVKFLIQDLLVEKSIGFLVGTGGVGKSSLCLEIAKAISSGDDFFGDSRFKTLQGTVAIINKEDSLVKVHNQIHNLVELDIERATNGAQSDFGEEVILNTTQIKDIKNKWQNVARPSWAQSNIRLTDGEGENLEALGAVLGSLKSLKEELAENKKPDLNLVIIDPLNLWHGGDQNSQKDMSYIFSALQQVQRELDVTVLIVHHMNKSKGFSGSHTIRDSGRFMWYLRPTMVGNDESDKLIDFYVEKNNDAKANYNALQFTRTDKGLLDVAHNIEQPGESDD